MASAIVIIVEEGDLEEATAKYKEDPTLEIKANSVDLSQLGIIPVLTGIKPAEYVIVLKRKPV